MKVSQILTCFLVPLLGTALPTPHELGLSSKATTGALSLRQQEAILTFFLKSARDDRIRQGYIGYGISRTELDAIDIQLCREVVQPALDFRQGQTLKSLADNLLKCVRDVTKKLSAPPNQILVERMKMQALTAWIRTHFSYNPSLDAPGIPREIRSRYWEATDLFQLPRLSAVCAGIANTTVQVGQEMGLNCRPINGFTRANYRNDSLPKTNHHKWILFQQSDGLLVPSDPTHSLVPLATARNLEGRILQGTIDLPASREEWAVFLAVYYGSHIEGGAKPIPETLNVTKLTLDEWRTVDIQSLKRDYYFATYGPWTKDAARAVPIN